MCYMFSYGAYIPHSPEFFNNFALKCFKNKKFIYKNLHILYNHQQSSITQIVKKEELLMDKYIEKYDNACDKDSKKIICTPSAFAKESLFYIQEAGNYKTLPEYFAERSHIHGMLVLYTLSGEGVLEYRDASHRLTQSSAFFINCMEYHKFYPAENYSWEFLWVQFYGCSCDGYYRYFDKIHSPVIKLSPYAPLPNNIKSLILTGGQNNVRSELNSSRIITSILTDILSAAVSKPQENESIPSIITDVSNFIENRFYEPISLNRISQKFSISKYHLVRKFKKYTGLAPGEYLIQCRLNHAKDLLINTNMRIYNVAKEAGIENESHFSSIFRKKIGMTPKKYRKSRQKPGTGSSSK